MRCRKTRLTARRRCTSQGTALLHQLLIADGLATDTASAAAYVASRTSAQIAQYLRTKSVPALLGTLLTKLAPLGPAGSGPIPDGSVLPVDPIAAVNAGQYLPVPVLRTRATKLSCFRPSSRCRRRSAASAPAGERCDAVLGAVRHDPTDRRRCADQS